MINSPEGKGDVHSYRTTSSEGWPLKSTTALIRDEGGRAIAAFCINLYTTEFYNAGQALLPFLHPDIGRFTQYRNLRPLGG